MKMNIVKSILILTFLFVYTLGQSQDRREKLEAEKIAYFTSELDLSAEEAQVFWPLYNEFNKKLRSEKKKIGEKARAYSEGEKTETDANDLINSALSAEQAELDLKREYFSKLSAVISPQKVAILLAVEKKYKESILKRIRKKMEKRRIKRGE